jgi:hypothetical protein
MLVGTLGPQCSRKLALCSWPVWLMRGWGWTFREEMLLLLGPNLKQNSRDWALAVPPRHPFLCISL